MPVTTNVLAQLHADASAIGPLRRDEVAIPGAGVTYTITRPADFDALLDAAAADPQQHLPYWAELWPSGIALAAALLAHGGSLTDVRALELGCGLGVTAIAALQRGVSLLATDYSPEALTLCALNAVQNAGRSPLTMRVNWREPDAAFLGAVGEGFPCVLAADVLYEGRDVEPLRNVVERCVGPGGDFWLAEPGRPPAARFLAAMSSSGWTGRTSAYTGPWPDPEDNEKGVEVRVHRLTRG